MHVEPLGTRSTAETAPRLRSRRRSDRTGRASPAIVAIAGECVCGNPTCANRCLGPASGEKRQVSRDQDSTVERADHARGRAHAVRATASRAASDAASRKRGMNASARSAGAHRGTPRPPRPRAARCGALRRITPAAGGFRRRAETPVRRTCTDVSYLRKRLSQFVGCTGFFLATM
ncbi:glycine betaine/L-proline ABC transporter, ATP-binding subunit [Burkholderia pseudomallei MSHR346]|nr:glycine betaine/L-proline ABC transporter, ATP-binding subunit [Burkholderia pseudomallei MSHR346]